MHCGAGVERVSVITLFILFSLQGQCGKTKKKKKWMFGLDTVAAVSNLWTMKCKKNSFLMWRMLKA